MNCIVNVPTNTNTQIIKNHTPVQYSTCISTKTSHQMKIKYLITFTYVQGHITLWPVLHNIFVIDQSTD